MKETDLYRQIAEYLNIQYPGILYHFDSAGIHNPSMFSRVLYSQLNGRGWPDLFIAVPKKGYSGLFIEIKIDTARKNTPHIAEQKAVLKRLHDNNYQAVITYGLEQAIQSIKDYLD